MRERGERISGDGAEVSVGSKALDILAKLVDAPGQASVRTISELGDVLSVNASTLTRLAKRLGFDGFNDYQSVFRQAIANDERYFYSRQAGRLLSAQAAESPGDRKSTRLNSSH